MIKQIQIKNFKSLKDVDLELGIRNTVVGPNMSGKSNFLDSLKFLTQMSMSGIIKAFLDRGGFQEVAWKGEDSGPISFRLVMELKPDENKPKNIYEYEISIIGSLTGVISIERESLIVRTENKTYTLVDLKNGQGEVKHPDGTSAFSPPGPGKSVLEFSVPGWEGMIVKYYIAWWRFYRLIPKLMKMAHDAVAQTFLEEDGGNFSSWLMTLQTSHPKEFNLIKQVAKDVFPELEEILTPPTQFGTTYLVTKEKHLKRNVAIWQMSDGEVAFLGWLSLIFAPVALGAPLVCVEEVENHLHPRLLETLVEVLRQRHKEVEPDVAQVITTTHSPYFVDRVDIEELIVFEKKNGATICTKPASKTHLKELLERKELGLGELWYSGALGG